MLSARPRLGSHVRARRHLVGGRATVVLHDEDRSLELGDREWTVLAQADGTRDLEGIRLAAERAGARVRADHVASFFEALAKLGLLEESEPCPTDEPAFARDLPVVALPEYRFHCDGSGGCCRQYDTILFTELDVARARAALPEDEPVFLPERGCASPLSVVTRREGACSYLDTSGRCAIHAAAGLRAKPTGCQTFPTRYVDVGDAIRAVPRLECACVFRRSQAGEPLTDAARGSELARERYVPRLPERVALGPELVGAPELVRFFDEASASALDARDLASFCWSLAERVATHGSAALDQELSSPEPDAVRASLARVEASARSLFARHVAWRAERDLVRRGVEWVRAALSRASALPSASEPDDEALYLRAAFFATVGAEHGVAAELRAMALAMWIARAFGEDARATSEAAHPLAIVEALARGHGLDLAGD